MSSNHIMDKEKSGITPKIDLNDIEMVFGTPNAPISGGKPEILIANERNHTEGTHNTSNRRGEAETETHSGQPLLEPDKEHSKPPLADPEVDDVEDMHTHIDIPHYPGIDDGLLEPIDKPNGHNGDGGHSHEDREGSHDTYNPHTHDDGVGTDRGKWWLSIDHTDQPDGFDSVNGLDNRFGEGRPLSPGLSSDPDVNTYQQKKNLAQGMMDLALLSANANQLRFVLEFSNTHPYYYASVTFISLSIILQIAVGVGLIMNSRYDVTNKVEICKADKINNMTVLGVFLITIVNVFITSFSGFSNGTTGGSLIPPTGATPIVQAG